MRRTKNAAAPIKAKNISPAIVAPIPIPAFAPVLRPDVAPAPPVALELDPADEVDAAVFAGTGVIVLEAEGDVLEVE